MPQQVCSQGLAGGDNDNEDKKPQKQQQTSGLQQQINGSNETASSANANIKTTTKLNGLKNRIIQRPPPLILDKVSNFYDNEQRQQQQELSNQTSSINNINPQTEQQSNNNPQSNANLKFWASLNQNAASRTARSRNTGGGMATSDAKESATTTTTTNDSLGADLIITHRNSNNGFGVNSNGGVVTNRASQNSLTPHKHHHPTTKTISEAKERELGEVPLRDVSSEANKSHEMSNNSELDGSNGGGASENDGGNLIGVDNLTPPTSADGYRQEDPPASAISSRPRSNNPFLSMNDEEDLLSKLESNGINNNINNSFHNRPASFIAATDASMMKKQPVFDSNNQQQQQVQEQFNVMHIDEDRQHMIHVQQTNPYAAKADEQVLVDRHDKIDSANIQSSMGQQLSNIQQAQQHQQPIYGVYCQQNNNSNSYMNYESTISMDSESAICKPPPSATMQLPHWTQAIYQLNNAILEANSVAGGSENGEFIYIVESGDIVLELDKIKVSGYTLVEFNELLGSKPVHLLNAVQTKHSHGISIDLKYYLNCSFPKNSDDKELQDLIRENIYRGTIPCTTRPPKEDEVDKVDYHFLNKEQFIEMNNRGMLLECGMFSGHYYGTMKPFSDLNSLSIYGSLNQKEISDDMRQPLNANHPAIGLTTRKEASQAQSSLGENPLYENYESLKMQASSNMLSKHNHSHQSSLMIENRTQPANIPLDPHRPLPSHILDNNNIQQEQSNIVAVDSEALPHGWERVIDQTHGTYYIDHNTQRTQYERPYEIELTKGSMGFGFTLVEADNGVLLVRSVIPGGPAHLSATIRPGDILISAVGVSVAGLQHTDIARLFSKFAVGDRVRLTFARSAYVVDANFVPDEYLFSNGTNGDLAVAVSSDYLNYFNRNMIASQIPHDILVDQEYEFITVSLKRGDQGFGFTISDSIAGQKVRKIQNNETCTNLKQGDILINLNGQDITKLTHKEVVERLKNCPAGQDVNLVVKRKRRFRSKTPMGIHTENDEYSSNITPQRNCKTPSLDGLMLRRSSNNNLFPPRNLIQSLPRAVPPISESRGFSHQNQHTLGVNMDVPLPRVSTDPNYCSLPLGGNIEPQPIYGVNPMNELHYGQQSHIQSMSLPTSQLVAGISSNNPHLNSQRLVSNGPPSLSNNSDGQLDNMTNSAQLSETSLPPMKFSTNVSGLSQMNQYNNFMNNDKLVMMQMQQQQRYQHMVSQASQLPIPVQAVNDYHHMPLYSNSDMIKAENSMLPIPAKPIPQYLPELPAPNNYYANNEELALQRVQYGCYNEQGMLPMGDAAAIFLQQQQHLAPYINNAQTTYEDHDEYEYHQVDLDRGNTESNWGIRLMGGSEVDRAISIGSIVFGGAAAKNGRLKSGDEIISINGINVVGATHQHVVELISACSNRASLVVRRKRFAEACEVVLTRSMDEGFGFVIISSGNCALIGRIIEGSPADRCQQLHVRDRIIAVNGRYITPDMQHPEIVNMIKECASNLRLRIIPADCYTVELIKSAQNDNFGFSMRGGSEYDGTPLYILRVAPNGLARDSLNVGDQIIEINNIPTVGMTHKQAAAIIKYSDPTVKLKLRRNYVTPPSLLVDSPRALQKFNQVTAEMKTVNANVAPHYLQEGSTTSEQGSLGQHQQQQYMMADQSQSGENNNSSSLVYSQSLPLYAT